MTLSRVGTYVSPIEHLRTVAVRDNETFIAIEQRVPTGTIKFGSDWPGIFIRGDEALALSRDIENVQRLGYLPTDGIGGNMLKRVIEMLVRCEVHNR